MIEIVEITGALLIPGAFVGTQTGALDQRSAPYLLSNLVGSAVLAAIALHGRSWGFLLLEGVWAVVSAWALLGALPGRRPGRGSGGRPGRRRRRRVVASPTG